MLTENSHEDEQVFGTHKSARGVLPQTTEPTRSQILAAAFECDCPRRTMTSHVGQDISSARRTPALLLFAEQVGAGTVQSHFGIRLEHFCPCFEIKRRRDISVKCDVLQAYILSQSIKNRRQYRRERRQGEIFEDIAAS
jgi:hypothetical protein